MSVAKAQEAVDAAVTSCERVTERAKKVTHSISQRIARSKTDPFVKVENEFDEEDSLITSVENVIANSSTSIKVKKEE